MIELNLPIQENKFYTSTTSYLLSGFQCFMRYFLTILYFGVLVAVMTESFLSLSSWVAKGQLPTVSEFGESIFYIVFSFITLSAPSMLAGLVFSVLASLLKNSRMLIILITSLACAWFNYHHLGQLSYPKNGNIYMLSSTTIVLATGYAAVFSALLGFLATGLLKPIFMPMPKLETVPDRKPAIGREKTPVKYIEAPTYALGLQPIC